jgi:membrane protein involved in colicin uptake
MSDASITNAFMHVAAAQVLVDTAISDLFAALDNVKNAAERLKNANAYGSDGNSEATEARLEAVKKFQGATDLIMELQGIQENLTDHLSSLRGELEAPV